PPVDCGRRVVVDGEHIVKVFRLPDQPLPVGHDRHRDEGESNSNHSNGFHTTDSPQKIITTHVPAMSTSNPVMTTCRARQPPIDIASGRLSSPDCWCSWPGRVS